MIHIFLDRITRHPHPTYLQIQQTRCDIRFAVESWFSSERPFSNRSKIRKWIWKDKQFHKKKHWFVQLSSKNKPKVKWNILWTILNLGKNPRKTTFVSFSWNMWWNQRRRVWPASFFHYQCWKTRTNSPTFFEKVWTIYEKK